MDYGQNKARTAFCFKVDRKIVREWVQNEALIRTTQLTRGKYVWKTSKVLHWWAENKELKRLREGKYMWNVAGLTKEGANIALTLSINSGISTYSLENFAVVLKYLWDGKHTQHKKRKRE